MKNRSTFDPGPPDKGLYWNSLPFGEFLWIRMGIHLRIYKDSPNSTEFQGMNRTPFFDPKKGVPYQSNHRNQQPTIGIGRIGLMADSLKSQDSLSVYCMVYLYAKGCHPGGAGGTRW